MTTPLRALAAIAITLSLGGCTGQYLATGETPRDNFIETGEVKLVPITPELINANPTGGTVQLPQELLNFHQDNYRIHGGDTLLVTVWDHPELSTPAGSQQQAVSNGRLVQPDGTFYFPYAGKMNIAGKTLEEVRTMLTSRLARYLREPQIDVNVIGSGSRVALAGAFTNTTPQQLTPVPLTLAQAVGQAGIAVDQADLSGLVLTRDGKSYTIDLDALSRSGGGIPDIDLKAGDRIFLPFNDRKEVYVVGEVPRPSAINFKTTDISLTQALGRAGGIDPVTGKASAVYVIRGADLDKASQNPSTVFHLNAKSPAAFALADRFMLRPGDVVWVGPAGVTRWDRVISQILPLASIARSASGTRYDLTR